MAWQKVMVGYAHVAYEGFSVEDAEAAFQAARMAAELEQGLAAGRTVTWQEGSVVKEQYVGRRDSKEEA